MEERRAKKKIKNIIFKENIRCLASYSRILPFLIFIGWHFQMENFHYRQPAAMRLKRCTALYAKFLSKVDRTQWTCAVVDFELWTRRGRRKHFTVQRGGGNLLIYEYRISRSLLRSVNEMVAVDIFKSFHFVVGDFQEYKRVAHFF
jgi:hypothetical protein